MDKKTFAALCDLYEKKLRLLRNPACLKCDATVRYPLSAWHVGNDFQKSPRRLLFIGKPHRGKPGKIRRSGVLDPRDTVDRLKDYSWPYWSYTREIATKLFGDRDRGWDAIALTNLVKCTRVSGGSSVDRTTEQMVRSCLIDVGALSAEVEMLKPTHLIFYTGKLFPVLLSEMEIEGSSNWHDVKRTSIPCGTKRMLWWDRKIRTSWGTLRALVTGHPERMKKEAFTRAIARWALLPAN